MCSSDLKIDLNINYYSNNIVINTLNNIKINELIDLVKKKLNIKNDVFIEQNKKILNSMKTLDYYNIKHNNELYVYNLQKA